MAAPALNAPLLAGLYAAIAATPAITNSIGTFQGAPNIHTRRPIPTGATNEPVIVIGPVITRVESDGINDYRPSVTLDIIVAGEQKDYYRQVETVADAIYSLFHRAKDSFSVTGWHVSEVRAVGPYPAPDDDDGTVARRVTLTIDLYAGA